jgi:chorismate synthase
MNGFGRQFRIQILGESHGECVGVLIDGCPAGLALDPGDFLEDIDRRRGGKSGTTDRAEIDIPRIRSGCHRGKTTGAPLMITFDNGDVDSSTYRKIADTPRPGHADFTARCKYGGFNDARGGGHFSGRLTAALVGVGVIAKKLIEPVRVEAGLLEAGGSREIGRAVADADREKDSVGGIVECRATGLPVGLGEPFFDSVESLVSHMVFSVGGVRGIEFGSGFACARMKGSQCNDPIIDVEGKTGSNHAGGVNGGLTNGNPLVFRVAIKPTSSIGIVQQTINLETGKPETITIAGRHDTCIALRIPVILEAVTASVIADLSLCQQLIPRVWKEE